MKRLFITLLFFLLIVPFINAGAVTGSQPVLHEGEAQVMNVPLSPNYERAEQVYTQLAWGTYLQTVKRLSEAKQAYSLALKEYDASAFVHTQVANLSLAMQDIRTAEQECRRAIEIDPEKPTSHFLLGQILIRRSRHAPEKWEEAIAEFQKVVELDPDHVDAYRYLGEIAAFRQNYDLAIHAFKELTRIMPYQPQFYLRLGSIYEQLGEKEKAITAYERAVKVDRDVQQGYEALGKLYVERYDEFEGQIYGQTELTPDLLKSAKDSLEKAISAYTEMRRLAPVTRHSDYDSALRAFRVRLGSLYLTFQKTGKAIEVLQGVLKEDPDHVDANFEIALAYQEVGDFDKAEAYFRKTISLAPDRGEAYNALGYLFAERGTNLDEAVELIQKALQKSPKNGAYLDSLGWVYFKRGNLEAALTELEKAIHFMPDSAEIQDHLGDAYFKKGMKLKAIAAWKKAIQLEPDNMEIQDKLKKYQGE